MICLVSISSYIMTSFLIKSFLLCLICFLNLVSSSVICSNTNCTVIPLNGKWSVSNNNGSLSFQGIIPGQIHLDLLRENIITEPYRGFNDEKLTWVALEDKWIYTRKITIDSNFKKYEKIFLCFEGIDTIASVFLQDTERKHFLFNASNQHRRYMYDTSSIISTGDSTVIVELFSSAELSRKYAAEYPYPVDQQFTYFADTNRNFVRKAQSDFGWDWGPAFAPVGIWKDVNMVGFSGFVISEFTPIVYWSEYNCFEVKIKVSIICTQKFNAKLTAVIKDVITHSANISCNQGDCEVVTSLMVDVNTVSLWWPNGHGEQPLYNISVGIQSENGLISYVSKVIGFRRIELVQEKYTGEDGLSFYFRINSVPIFIKGSNWIPADAFTGRVSRERLDRLLTSAVLSNQNMVQVWGGGIYQQDEFYELCNQKGLLVWQEFMFACSLYPRDAEFLENVREEIVFQIRRLSHNPSIVLWSGNNENQDTAVRAGTRASVDYVALYDDVIRRTLYQEDLSRPFWPSSPSNGDLVVNIARELFIQRWGESQNTSYGDIHRYDYLSKCTDVSIYPRPRFVSEYGFQSYPSILSFIPVIDDVSDLDIDSPFMFHRQHHPNGNMQLLNQIQMYFKLPNNTNKVTQFDNLVFLTQIVQGICMQSQTEHYRRIRNETGHTMGTMYWQLNDIWQAPSWSSIEYDGRWKALHYIVKRYYEPILVSAYHMNDTLYVYVINDEDTLLNGYVVVVVVQWSQSIMDYKYINISVPAYSSSLILSLPNLEDSCGDLRDCYFYMLLYSTDSTNISSSNFYFPVPFKEVSLPNSVIKIKDCTQTDDTVFRIQLFANAVTLYVFLETKYSGYFSDNAFIVNYGIVTVEFYSWDKINEDICESFSVKSISSIYQD